MDIVRRNQVDTSLILSGDLNLRPEDEAKVKVDCPENSGTFSCPAGPLASKWKKLFDLTVEIKVSQPNHFRAANNTLNTLTRTFLFVGRSVR